jgi:hypothetical protein
MKRKQYREENIIDIQVDLLDAKKLRALKQQHQKLDRLRQSGRTAHAPNVATSSERVLCSGKNVTFDEQMPEPFFSSSAR